MGKVKTGLYILTRDLQKCSSSCSLPNISFLSRPLNLIGCHGNRKAKFPKIKIQTHLLTSHNGNKAETLQKRFVRLACTKMVFITVSCVLSLLWQFEVSIGL